MAFLRKTALAVVFAAVAAAGAAAMAGPAAAETVLTRGMGSTIGSLDPQINFLANEGWIQDDMYEGLVDMSAGGEVLPGAAEKWDVSDDGLTYTFHLRAGLKWSNGDPLVAQDFVNSIIRTIDPATASQKNYIFTSTISVTGAADFGSGKNKDPNSVGVTAPDAKTVVIKLDKPAPYALLMLNSFYVAPLHKPSLDKFGKDFVKPENIVSNGPYHMTENVPQSHVTLVKNPNYWDAANVKIDKIIYKVTEDDQTAVKLFKSGALDITADIPPDQIEPLKKAYGKAVHVTNSTETLYIDFNIKKPPFDNQKLRQALTLAVDRDTAVNKVVRGGEVPNCSFTIPIPGYDAPKALGCGMSKADRLAQAKKLYVEAGFGPNKKLSLAIESTNSESSKKLAETVAVMWKQALGVDAKVNAQDRDSWNNAFTAGNWQVYNDDLIGDFAGPETFLAYLDPRAESGYNWESKDYQDLMDKAMLITDQVARYKVLAQAEKTLLDTNLMIPMAAAPNRALVRATVQGWVDNPAGWHGSKYMTIGQ